jgi:hypothetical protein
VWASGWPWQRYDQCTINGAASSVLGSGNNLTLTLAIAFTGSFSGNKIFYLSAQDKSSNNSGWQALGTWGNVQTILHLRSLGTRQPSLPHVGFPTKSNLFSDVTGRSRHLLPRIVNTPTPIEVFHSTAIILNVNE